MNMNTLETYQSGFTQQYVAKDGNDIGTGSTPNKALFTLRYTQALAQALKDYPEEYCWPACEIYVVLGRMVNALNKGSYNKDSRAFKATCKQLAIPYTYAGINTFWNS